LLAIEAGAEDFTTEDEMLAIYRSLRRSTRCAKPWLTPARARVVEIEKVPNLTVPSRRSRRCRPEAARPPGDLDDVAAVYSTRSSRTRSRSLQTADTSRVCH